MKFKNGRQNPDSIWSQADIISMLQNGNVDITKILTDVCQCNKGQPIPIKDAQEVIQEFDIAGEVLVIGFAEYNNET